MYSFIGGIFNVNVFLWSIVLEEVERTHILLLTGVRANEITHFFSIYMIRPVLFILFFSKSVQ